MLLLRPLIRYADFKGRARRGEYWLFVTVQGIVLGLPIGLGLASASSGSAAGGAALLGMMALTGLLIIALIVPNYALLARRLHDIDKSAKWMGLLLPGVLSQIMIIGSAFEVARHAATNAPAETAVPALLAGLGAAGVMGIVGMVCNLILFVMTMLPGTAGSNRFGHDPKDPSGQINDIASVFDDDKLEDLFAQARRERQAAEGPYKPVFDFGPGPATPEPVARPAVSWSTPAYDPGIAPSRPFGRRAG